VKMTFFSGYVHRFAIAPACSDCDSVPNPVTRLCGTCLLCSAPASCKSETGHGNLGKHLRLRRNGGVSWCNNGDGKIFPASLVLKPSENPDDPGCPCAIGSSADVFLWSHGIAFVCPRTEVVNHGDWSLRTTSKIDGAVTRIRNPSPRNRDFHRTKFQRVICSRS
jgi:hypothetical protein